jgi:thiol-disulfide isomerase/thioredoxin
MATTELLTRALMAVAIAGVGAGMYGLANRIALARAAKKYQGLESFKLGIPAILYFTIPTCGPCKIVQRPAIQTVKQILGDQIQVIEIDASESTELADYWGVLSVPTTFIVDKKGEPRHINHGVTRADKLLQQVQDA